MKVKSAYCIEQFELDSLPRNPCRLCEMARSLMSAAVHLIPPRYRSRGRAGYNRFRKAITDRFLSYGKVELIDALHRVGVARGDVLIVHSAFTPFLGFRGSPKDAIDAMLDALGPSGTLLMPSLPYTGSTAKYLDSNPSFDVKRTPSRMGILTEVFRRRPGVIRSLNPSHPLLGLGADASTILRDHDLCLKPCGAGSPFERLLDHHGKMLFFAAPLNTMTFVHHLEDRYAAELPLHLYEEVPRTVTVTDDEGKTRHATVFVFNPAASRARNVSHLLAELHASGSISSVRIGATRLRLIEVRDAVKAAEALHRKRKSFVFDVPT